MYTIIYIVKHIYKYIVKLTIYVIVYTRTQLYIVNFAVYIYIYIYIHIHAGSVYFIRLLTINCRSHWGRGSMHQMSTLAPTWDRGPSHTRGMSVCPRFCVLMLACVGSGLATRLITGQRSPARCS
jgi:hypothetical protein